MTYEQSIIEAAQLGFAAGYFADDEQNPFAYETAEWNAWNNGYRQGYNDAAEEMRNASSRHASCVEQFLITQAKEM